MLDREPLRSKTFDALDFAAMEAVATFHRGGRLCRVNKSIYAYGGDNLVLEILFDDEMVWIVRLRLHETKFLQPSVDISDRHVTVFKMPMVTRPSELGIATLRQLGVIIQLSPTGRGIEIY